MKNKTTDSTHDLDLRVFDTETTASNVTDGGQISAVTDNLSNILGEINSNNYQEDDLMQIHPAYNGQRISHRRSSVS